MAVRRALVRLTCGRVAARNRSRHAGSSEVKRILVIRPDHLGDLLFATAALDRLRAAFPEAHITGAVGPWGKAMWQGNPALDALEVITFPGIAGRSTDGTLGPYKLLSKAGVHLGSRGYDMGVVLRFDHWWGAAMLWAAGVPRRWGYDTPGMGTWLNHKARYVRNGHEVEQDLHLVDAVIKGTKGAVAQEPLLINRKAGEPHLRVPIAEPCGSVPGEWLDAPRKVAIHAGTGASNKLWTITGWAHVADALSREGWAVALTGAPNEWVLAEAIRDSSRSKPLNLAGKTENLGQLAWVLGQADMVLGVDSGPLHMACALDRPSLHLYGPSDETIWGPWGDPARHIAFRAPGTRPSMLLDMLSQDLEGGLEMRAITAEMVLAQVHELEKLAPVAG